MGDKDAADQPSGGTAQRKDYRVLLENWRCAILLSGDLEPSDKELARLMLQCSSRARFYEEGKLVCWPGNESIAQALGLSGRTITRARGRLEQHGVIEWIGGGEGPGDPAVIAFRSEWLEARMLEIDASGRAEAFAGIIPFVHRRKRVTHVSPIGAAASRRRPTSTRSSPAAEGRHTAPKKGDTAMSPDPCESNPLPSLRDGDASRTTVNPWPEEAIAWIKDVSAQQGRSEPSIARVLNALAKDHGFDVVTQAIDRILMTGAEGIDPIGLLNAFIRQVEER